MYPSIEILHPIDVGKLTLKQAARVSDLCAMLLDPIKTSFVELILDTDEIFLSIISLDPRVIVLLSQAKDHDLKNPLRFKICDVTEPELVAPSINGFVVASLGEVRLSVTRELVYDIVPLGALVPDVLESVNPLFEGF